MTRARTNADNVTADIAGITAGTGITGGGTSGTVTITNDMATTIAAKGDILAGTANDAYSALTVGTNENRIVADSAQATGLKYVADTTNYAIAAKGDLLAGTAADTLAALTVGANGTVLTAASSAATGLQWATPSSGGMTLISTTAITGAAIVLSSIPSGYVDLKLVLIDPYMTEDGANVKIRLNSDNTYIYGSVAMTTSGGLSSISSNDYLIGYDMDNTSHTNYIEFNLSNYSNSTTWKVGNASSIARNAGTPASASYITSNLLFGSTTAITSILIFTTGGNFSGGTAYLYGVK